MKEDILKRAMFSMPLSKEARNSGIMSGFDLDEMEDAADQDENAEMEEMPAMARTPQNPEILMNNLRGDMRSVDARYMELAQMVGEEAAQETPPEVLAMLQPQLAAQQGGIGSLPQAQGMMPPGAQQPAPGQQGGAPASQGAPAQQGGAPAQSGSAMPQGGISMPQGMESAPPFSQGAEAPQGYAHGGMVAPPTPDGMPPMHAFAGAFVNPAMRAAQFLGDKASTYGSAANAALGRMFMSPQFGVERLTGGAPAIPLTVQKAESLLIDPRTGNIVQGVGNKLAPYTSLSNLQSPTFTEGLSRGMQRLGEQYPRLSNALAPVAAGATWASTILGRNAPENPEEEARRQDLISQIPTDTRQGLIDSATTLQYGPMAAEETRRLVGNYPAPAKITAPAPSTATAMAQAFPEDFGAEPEKKDTSSFIADQLKDAGKEKTKAERIKAGMEGYAPMFRELLGEDKESAKMNALLLLSEAGLKLASTRKPTLGMAIGEAFAGVPRGMAAIAAQERELDMKAKSAALQQAINEVDAEDKAAVARQLEFLKFTGKQILEREKNQQVTYEDGGAGLRIGKTKGGGYSDSYIDANDPVVQQIATSPFMHRPSSPFVRDTGQATSLVVRDPKRRDDVVESMNEIGSIIGTIDSMQNVVGNAFGPGTWAVDLKNNVFVPLVPGAAPEVNRANAISLLKSGFSDISRGAAKVGGKLAVQQEKWERDNNKALAEPAGFLTNSELAAGLLSTLRTTYLNEWNNKANQLGIGTRNMVMRTPPTGTQNDPFIMPSDPEDQVKMANFLKATLGRVDNPQAGVFIRLPNSATSVRVPVSNLLSGTLTTQ